MAEIDLDRLTNDRLRFKTSLWEDRDATYVTFSSRAYDDIELSRKVDAYPFVLQDDKLRIERCQDIINMISARYDNVGIILFLRSDMAQNAIKVNYEQFKQAQLCKL